MKKFDRDVLLALSALVDKILEYKTSLSLSDEDVSEVLAGVSGLTKRIAGNDGLDHSQITRWAKHCDDLVIKNENLNGRFTRAGKWSGPIVTETLLGQGSLVPYDLTKFSPREIFQDCLESNDLLPISFDNSRWRSLADVYLGADKERFDREVIGPIAKDFGHDLFGHVVHDRQGLYALIDGFDEVVFVGAGNLIREIGGKYHHCHADYVKKSRFTWERFWPRLVDRDDLALLWLVDSNYPSDGLLHFLAELINAMQRSQYWFETTDTQSHLSNASVLADLILQSHEDEGTRTYTAGYIHRYIPLYTQVEDILAESTSEVGEEEWNAVKAGDIHWTEFVDLLRRDTQSDW
jgi:hypothetical protein